MAIQQILAAYGAPVGGDPSFASVVSLLHFDGANGSTSFTDVKGLAWTAQGAAQITTSQSRFGGSSLNLGGSGDWAQTTQSLNSFLWGLGDFTLEGFVRTTAGDKAIFDRYSGSIPNGYQLYISASGRLEWYSSNGSGAVLVVGASAGDVRSGTWRHVAVCRAGTTTRLFLDGVQVGSATDSRNYNASLITPFAIGAQVFSRNAAYDFVGQIDEVRITNGVARYTTNFTPPSAPFPDF